MKIDQVRAKTSKSAEKLELAKELAEKALQFPEGSKEREVLEAQAQELVDEARKLAETARQEIGKYK